MLIDDRRLPKRKPEVRHPLGAGERAQRLVDQSLESDDETPPMTLDLVKVVIHRAQSRRQIAEPGGCVLRQFDSCGPGDLFLDRGR
jgi:hypothetical protein